MDDNNDNDNDGNSDNDNDRAIHLCVSAFPEFWKTFGLSQLLRAADTHLIFCQG